MDNRKLEAPTAGTEPQVYLFQAVTIYDFYQGRPRGRHAQWHNYTAGEIFWVVAEEAFVEADSSDPTAEKAEKAVIEAGMVHEEDQVTDALLRLRTVDGRRVSPVGQFTNM